ncbi:MAG TPA: SBBP repeat-containing protein [Thermoanaerobaculia bacterium]|nr:SBBP repeat-containing protein [Thermoanaerobaculia bacterium]
MNQNEPSRKNFLHESFRKGRFVALTMAALVGCCPVAPSFGTATADRALRPAARKAADFSAKLPIRFEENVGQVKDGDVRFFARGRGYRLFLGREGAVFSLGNAMSATGTTGTMRLRLAGGAEGTAPLGIDRMKTQSNYLLGNDPSAWHLRVPSFAGVRYEEVYPGTDVVFSGNERRVEQSFFLDAKAEPRRIRLVYEGASAVEIGKAGELILRAGRAGEAELTAARPIAYQVVRGERRPIEVRYQILAQGTGAPEVGFALGKYDRKLPLVIDPVFINNTFLGGSEEDSAAAVGVDGSGNVYLAGYTASTDFPGMPGALQASSGGSYDGFVAKVDPTGATLLYATYLGGDGFDAVNGIAVDAAGNAYLTGDTQSSDFPGVTGASIQSSLAGDGDAFAAKLNPAGSALLYSTYLGGSGFDTGKGIAIDGSGNAVVAGATDSTDFIGVTGSSLQPSQDGGTDAFVTQIDDTGSAILYSTYLGASEEDQAAGVGVDGSGDAVVVGTTCSSAFPVTAGVVEPAPPGVDCGNGFHDAFVAKLDPSGAALVYSTFLGGEKNDDARGLAVDAAGNAYVVGTTDSTVFTGVGPGSMQPGNPFQGTAAFLTKLGPAGDAVGYSTFLGGLLDGETSGQGVAVDSSGRAYVTGGITSDDGIPIAPLGPSNTLQTQFAGDSDGFMTRFDVTGQLVELSTLLGGPGSDTGYAVALDESRQAIYVVGGSTSEVLPGDNSGSIQPAAAGGGDAFLVRILPGPFLTLEKEDDQPFNVDPGTRITYTLTYENIGDGDGVGATLTETVPVNTVFKPTFSTPGWSCTPNDEAGSECTLAIGTVTAGGGGSATFAVKVKNKLLAGDSTIHNTACIHPGNHCAERGTGTTAAPLLTITKIAQFNVARPGNTLSWKIKYANAGNQDADPVFLTDTVPGNTVFNPGASTAGWSCAPNNSAGSVCTFPLGNVAAGAQGNVIFAVTLATTLSNTACVVTDVPSPELAPALGKPLTPVACSTATTPFN